MKEQRVLRVQCADCGQLNVIPMGEAASPGEPIRCEKCGRVLMMRD